MTVISDRLMISFEEKVYIKKCKRKIVETTMIENLSKEITILPNEIIEENF